MEIKSLTGMKRSRGKIKVILKSEIEEAQRNTNSNMAAARYLNVNYSRYKKYATLYGLFEGHLNPKGFGVDKGLAKRANSIPLRDILEGKVPGYSVTRLKSRLIARKKLEEKCYLCGFSEKRITDLKTPLIINFIDGNRENYMLSNLNLLCYNCLFLTTGAPTVAYRNKIKGSLENPPKLSEVTGKGISLRDYHEKEDEDLWKYELTEEERKELKEFATENK